MSILVNKDSKVIVQGFTRIEGTFHAGQMTDTLVATGAGKSGSRSFEFKCAQIRCCITDAALPFQILCQVK